MSQFRSAPGASRKSVSHHATNAFPRHGRIGRLLRFHRPCPARQRPHARQAGRLRRPADGQAPGCRRHDRSGGVEGGGRDRRPRVAESRRQPAHHAAHHLFPGVGCRQSLRRLPHLDHARLQAAGERPRARHGHRLRRRDGIQSPADGQEHPRRRDRQLLQVFHHLLRLRRRPRAGVGRPDLPQLAAPLQNGRAAHRGRHRPLGRPLVGGGDRDAGEGFRTRRPESRRRHLEDAARLQPHPGLFSGGGAAGQQLLRFDRLADDDARRKHARRAGDDGRTARPQGRRGRSADQRPQPDGEARLARRGGPRRKSRRSEAARGAARKADEARGRAWADGGVSPR